MIISLIAAVAKNGVIGHENKMIWHLSDDLKRFKRLTKGHHVLMGRKTYESLGKPLPGRTNVVISRRKDHQLDGVEIYASIEAAIKSVQSRGETELFVIGGGQIYSECLAMAHKIYLTRVDCMPYGDVFFPDIDIRKWKIGLVELHEADDRNDHDFAIIDLVRKKH